MKDKFEYENYIKNILENTYSERYSNLLKSESPDFHNVFVGLEITTATNKIEVEIDSFFSKYANTPKKEIPAKLLHKIEQKTHLVYYNKILRGYADKFKYSLSIITEIKNIINNKLIKLNGHYKIFHYNDIAIHVRECFPYYGEEQDIENDIIEEFLVLTKEAVSEINKNYKITFNLVHIIYENLLLSLDINNNIQSYVAIGKNS